MISAYNTHDYYMIISHVKHIVKEIKNHYIQLRKVFNYSIILVLFAIGNHNFFAIKKSIIFTN